MLAMFERRKAATTLGEANQGEDLAPHWRDWRAMIVDAADGGEPDETLLNAVEEILGKTDEDFQFEVRRVKERRHATHAKAQIPAIVAEIRQVRADVTKGLEGWQAAKVVIPREVALQEQLRRYSQLQSPADDVPKFLANAIADNRSESTRLNDRLQSLTSQNFNVVAALAAAKQSRGRQQSFVTTTAADLYTVNRKISELEKALTLIEDEQSQIATRLPELQSEAGRLNAFALRDDAWLLLPEDIV